MKVVGYTSKWDKERRYGKIEFETDSEELYKRVVAYIDDCVDAINYRNQIRRTTII